MPFEIHIPDPVATEIREWNLPAAMLAQLYQLLADDLGTDPKRVLRDIRAPFPALQYSCTIPDSDDPSKRHTFLFRIKYSQDETALVIVSAGHLPPDWLVVSR